MLGEVSLRHTFALDKFLLTSDALLCGNQAGGKQASLSSTMRGFE